jgi:hypothetical protein
VVIVDYPVLPWIGVVALGYCFGNLYQSDREVSKRIKKLLILGSVAILLFILLRFVNVYGDPRPWVTQKSTVFTILSWLRVTKYPPSLQFILLTVGTGIFFFSSSRKVFKYFWKSYHPHRQSSHVLLPGSYYLIHTLALFAAKFSGYNWNDMISQKPLIPVIKGYGFSLSIVYLIWLIVILLLYPLCKWYDNYKSRNRKWWLSYL